MKSEEEIVEQIIDIEARVYGDDEAYLDESEQATLSTLYNILNRFLTEEEKERVKETAKVYQGIDEEE